MTPIDLAQALATFDDLWSPRIVTRVNDYDVRIAKVCGEHVWHVHETTDEFFLVLAGELTIELRESAVVLPRGSVYVVPRGVEHRPSALEGTAILMFEPAGTVTTGDHQADLAQRVPTTAGRPL